MKILLYIEISMRRVYKGICENSRNLKCESFLFISIDFKIILFYELKPLKHE